jgi:hypothetical protein
MLRRLGHVAEGGEKGAKSASRLDVGHDFLMAAAGKAGLETAPAARCPRLLWTGIPLDFAF